MQRQSSVTLAGISWQLNLPPPFLTYQLPCYIPDLSYGQVVGEDDGSGLHTPVSSSRLDLTATTSTPTASQLLHCFCINLEAWSLVKAHAGPTGREMKGGFPWRAQNSSLFPKQCQFSLGLSALWCPWTWLRSERIYNSEHFSSNLDTGPWQWLLGNRNS